MSIDQPDQARMNALKAEWMAVTTKPTPDPKRFETVEQEAARLIDAGLWTSGPGDLLTVLGRHRDELMHSRLIAWLLVPTNRHGIGRRFLRGFLDYLWPGEDLMATGPVSVETEVTRAGLDDSGRLREARADVVLHGDGIAIVIENKLDAGEGFEQCERLYWAWAAEPEETRWVFLTPTGRTPVTVTSAAAMAAWRPLGYAELRALVAAAIGGAGDSPSTGRSTAGQYLATLAGVTP